MATIAVGDPAQGTSAKPPISQHPAFPAVVALWFSALLGLGTLVLPIILLERFVETTGLAAILPAASPPLGFTARGIVAALAAVAGGLLGFAVARRIVRVPAPRARIVATGGESRRPISAHDELGDEGLGSAGSGPRRRSLAMAEDDRPSDYLWLAPLPGEEYQGHASAHLAAAPEEPDALELGVFAAEAMADEELATPAVAGAPFEPTSHAPVAKLESQDFYMSDTPPVQFPTAEERERRGLDRRTSKGTSPAGIERRLFMRRAHDEEPLPFVAPSFGRRALADNENAAVEVVADSSGLDHKPIFTNAEMTPGEDEAATPEPAEPVDWTSAPLERLGMVQLVQRLGASLDKRRLQAAQASVEPVVEAAVVTPLPVSAPDEFEAAAANEAAHAMAAYFGRPASVDADAGPEPEAEPQAVFALPMTAPFAPVAASEVDADQDSDDVAASFALPLRRRAPATQDFMADPDDSSADDDNDFGSLLSLGNPFAEKRETFVRIDDKQRPDEDVLPPTVVFPGQASAPARSEPQRLFDRPNEAGTATAPASHGQSAEADEALRKALATLQRMSSAS